MAEQKQQFRIWTINDFEIGKLLGSGKFGKAYLAREKETKFVIVLKILKKKELVKYNQEKQLRNEIDIQYRIRHENILRLYGYFWDNSRIYLILEYAPDGDVFTELREKNRFSEPLAANYISQILKGFIYLHSNRVIHRDLKPENLLNSCGTIKIADFGWSTYSDSRRKTFCGTTEYVPPEMVNQEEYDYRIDYWAIGVLTYEFVVGYTPFVRSDMNPDSREIFKNIARMEFEFPYFLSKEVKDFISKLLIREPEKRMTLEEALQHAWIVNNSQ